MLPLSRTIMRIDVYLFENGFTRSRTEAKTLIDEGVVYINGAVVRKASLDVPNSASVEVKRNRASYVSRGGYKLEAALSAFGIDPCDQKCLDIGASSGGFTDCLLRNGASFVTAVDSGTMQLADVLRSDSRVFVMENTNARYLTPDMISYVPTLAVMDVSFISATYLLESVSSILSDGGDFICLIKPQFEVGKKGLGKHGIIRDEKYRKAACDKVTASAEAVGFLLIDLIESPIVGGDGNVEYLAHFKKQN